jgi:hypothetical protein
VLVGDHTAKDLSCGALCSRDVRALEFQPALVEFVPQRTWGIWCKNLASQNVSLEIRLQDGSLVSLESTTNLYGGLQQAMLAGDRPQGRPALLWIDTKHCQLAVEDALDSRALKTVVAKTRLLEKKLPGFVHVLRAPRCGLSSMPTRWPRCSGRFHA